MEEKKQNESKKYYSNPIADKSREQHSLPLTSQRSINQYIAAQQHLKIQKQIYGQLKAKDNVSEPSAYQQPQVSKPFHVPISNSMPFPLNPSSTTNSTKGGHSHADAFSIGENLTELLTMQSDSVLPVESLKDNASYSARPDNSVFLKYQDGNDIESLLNEQDYLDFNFVTSNPQLQPQNFMVSSGSQFNLKEQENEDVDKNNRSEDDVFNELLSLAHNHNFTSEPQVSLGYNSAIQNSRDDINFISRDNSCRNSQYNEYYFNRIPSLQGQHKRNFKLEIVQQPSRARMCGYRNKDRRPITPPPIIKLVVASEDGQIIDPGTFDTSFIILICDSCQQEDEEYTEGLGESSPQLVTFVSNEDPSVVRMRNLVGSSVCSANKLYDLEGNLGIFFIFQDISLRTEGRFKLKLSLVDIGSPFSHTVNTSSISQVISTVYTDTFTVYTAKNFPGVAGSTPLTQCFSRQGIKIPFRRDIGKETTQKKKQVE